MPWSVAALLILVAVSPLLGSGDQLSAVRRLGVLLVAWKRTIARRKEYSEALADDRDSQTNLTEPGPCSLSKWNAALRRASRTRNNAE